MATGRPTKYKEEKAAKFLAALKTGMTRRAACGIAHIPMTTFFRWQQKNGTFGQLVEEAEAEAEAQYTAVVAESALKDRDPKTAMEWLKRRRRGDWGDKLEVGGAMDVSVVRKLSDAELIEAAQNRIRKLLSGQGADRLPDGNGTAGPKPDGDGAHS